MNQLMLLIDAASKLLVLLILIAVVTGIVALIVTAVSKKRERSDPRRVRKDSSGLLQYHTGIHYERVIKIDYDGDFPDVADDDPSDDSPSTATEKPALVIRYFGNSLADGDETFSQLVDEAIINWNTKRISRVVVVINSPGGTVHGYGHLMALMDRMRSVSLPIDCCIDLVAASGGYMMALPGNRLIAAPFAYVGSVGVVAQMPEISLFLDKLGVRMRTFTAGSKKRTVTLTDGRNEEAEAYFQQELDKTHAAFLALVLKYRPNANLEVISEAACYSAQESVVLNLGLVDQISTSSEYLLKLNTQMDLVYASKRRDGREHFASLFAACMEHTVLRLARRFNIQIA